MIHIKIVWSRDNTLQPAAGDSRVTWSRLGGEANVAHYRAYRKGSDGRIRQGADLDCADDEAAIEAAKELVGEDAVELCRDMRMVARLEPTKK